MSFSVVLLVIGSVALVCAMIMLRVLYKIEDKFDIPMPFVIAEGLLITAGLICLLYSGVHHYHYFKAKNAVEIINTEYGTSYTTEQYFYQSDLILRIIEKKKSGWEIIP